MSLPTVSSVRVKHVQSGLSALFAFMVLIFEDVKGAGLDTPYLEISGTTWTGKLLF
jgi:hypothetical protein